MEERRSLEPHEESFILDGRAMKSHNASEEPFIEWKSVFLCGCSFNALAKATINTEFKELFGQSCNQPVNRTIPDLVF